MRYCFITQLEDGRTIRKSKDYASTDQLVKEGLPEVLEAYQKEFGKTEEGMLQDIYENVAKAPDEGEQFLIYDMPSWCGDGVSVKLYPDVDRIYIVKF